MDFSDTGLPRDPMIEKAFARLATGEHAWHLETMARIARNVAGSGASPVVVCATLMYLDLWNQPKGTPGAAWLDGMHAGFGDEAFMELEHIMSADFSAALNGEVEPLKDAHPTAKLYSLAHMLFLLDDDLDKSFNGNFSCDLSQGGGWRKEPPNEYALQGLNDMAVRAAAILNACRGANPVLEARLADIIRVTCRAVDVAEDERTRIKRAWRDSRMFPDPKP